MIDTNKIICGNHLEVLSKFEDECIDLTVTSPPYDNLRDYKGYTFDFENLAKELFRVTKQGGVVVWVVGDATIKGSETGTSFKQALYFKDIGFNLHDTMIYEKDAFANPSSNRYHQVFEYMFVLSKGKPKIINLIRDKLNKTAGRVVSGGTIRNKDGSLTPRREYTVSSLGFRFNIWRFLCGADKSCSNRIALQHPAIFPEQLAKDHIISWSNECDIVLDPMCGSGTTCLMAKELNRKYIGIDISKEYCQLSEKRLSYDQDVMDLASELKLSDYEDLLELT